MTQWVNRGLGLFATLCLTGPLAAATFEAETLCTGALVFPNEDGSSETYDVSIAFAGEVYEISMTNTRTGEANTDRGRCDEYVGGICHHYIMVDGGRTDDFYAFGLLRQNARRFVYEEVWRDGSSARTVLSCGSR